MNSNMFSGKSCHGWQVFIWNTITHQLQYISIEYIFIRHNIYCKTITVACFIPLPININSYIHRLWYKLRLCPINVNMSRLWSSWRRLCLLWFFYCDFPQWLYIIREKSWNDVRFTISKENAHKNLSWNEINVHDEHAHDYHFSLSRRAHFLACVDKCNTRNLPKTNTTKYHFKILCMCISKRTFSTECS